MNKDTSEYTNYTGGAYGVDSMGDIIGRKYGFNNHIHFRPYDNIRMSKKLREIGVEPQVLTEKQVAHGRDRVNTLLVTNYQDDIAGNLQGRNYYQVMFSEAVYCISKIKDSVTISGGTNTAFQVAVKMMKHVQVYDLNTSVWYYYDYNAKELLQVPESVTVTIKPKYAIVGTRDVEDYHVKNKKTGIWESRWQYLGRDKEKEVVEVISKLYENTLDSIK